MEDKNQQKSVGEQLVRITAEEGANKVAKYKKLKTD